MTNESRPIWTEGICGDGAAILKDGVMQPIEDVIAALNAAELSQPEVVGLSDDTIEADFRSWYNERYRHQYFGAIGLVECIEWTRYALTRYATPQPSPVPVPVAVVERLLAAIDRLSSHGDSPHGPGSRLILTVDVDELEQLAAETRVLLSLPVPGAEVG